ncbi:MAG TPA: DUF6800 family protein [Candidatus Bathyarchaeia archaeon]|nr:DUF6800 family protein [Candidatus Bathyarchaeia archaeon]
MGRISPTNRKVEIAKKRGRQIKLSKLRQKLSQADSSLKREKILEKIKRVAPWLTEKEILASLKDK